MSKPFKWQTSQIEEVQTRDDDSEKSTDRAKERDRTRERNARETSAGGVEGEFRRNYLYHHNLGHLDHDHI